ncbi:MAG: MFS transporter [Gammaproteobacteria bacterium]|nr:MFS transporter [Gammaproteobacteria bacterium]
MAIAIGAILYSLLTILIAPSLVGGMVEQLDFGLGEAAEAIAANTLGASVGNVFVLATVARLRFRAYAISSVLLIALAEILVACTTSPGTMFAAFCLRGIGAGILLAALLLFLSRDANKERYFALVFGIQFVVAGLGVFAMPTIFAAIGWRGFFLAQMLLGVVVLVSCLRLPNDRHNIATSSPRQRSPFMSWLSIPVALCLTAYLLHFVANSSIWSFLERIGSAMQFADQTVANAMAIGMLVGAAASIVPITLGLRFGRNLPLLGGIMLIAGATLLLVGDAPIWRFAASIALFTSAMSITMPYFQGLQSELDETGRALSAGTVVLNAGWFVGPVMGAVLVERHGFNTLLFAATGLFVLSLLLVAAATHSLSRSGTPD